MHQYFKTIRGVITITALTVSIIFALMAKDIYTATAVLKIQKPSSGGILDAPLLPEFSSFGDDRFIANEIEIFKSYRLRTIVANALVDSFNVINEPDNFYNILDREFELIDESNGSKTKNNSSSEVEN